MNKPILKLTLLFVLAGATGRPSAAQFEQLEPPPEMASLTFMLGDWTVSGAFRTPDLIAADRTLWYETDQGVIRFDGAAWTAFRSGHPTADSVSTLLGSGTPYAFASELTVTQVQDGFVFLMDEGKTSGTTLIFRDTAAMAWRSVSIHAPTAAVTSASSGSGTPSPVFTGRATDRRGERVFRTRYDSLDPDTFVTRTDVSFDDGVSWILNQVVKTMSRK